MLTVSIFSQFLINFDSESTEQETELPHASQTYPYPTSIDMNYGTKENSNYEYLSRDDGSNLEIDLTPNALARNLDWASWLNNYRPWSIVDRTSTQHLRTLDLYDDSTSDYSRAERHYTTTTNNMYFSFRFLFPDATRYMCLHIYDSGINDAVCMIIANGLVRTYTGGSYTTLGTFVSNQLVHLRIYMNLATDKATYWLDGTLIGEYAFRYALTNLQWLKLESEIATSGYHIYIDSPIWTDSEDVAKSNYVPADRWDYTLDSEITFNAAQLTDESINSLFMRYSNTQAVSLSIQLYDFNTATYDEITTKSFTTENSFTIDTIGNEYINSNQLKLRILGKSYTSFVVTLDTLYLELNDNEFNGIETFQLNSQGSDPWTAYKIGSAKVNNTVKGHSKVYELENASRGLAITNDMNSDWTIESYIMIENLGAGSGCILLNLYGPTNIKMQYGYNQSGGYWAKNYTGISESNSIQETENWSSNAWMHWRVMWNAASDDFTFYVNDTLLDTHNYPDFTSLEGVAVDGNSSGTSGKTWIDSFSWSWHQDYYDRMIFDPIDSTDADSDQMPNVWETDNGLNPHLASDASSDADGDGLSNLNEFLNDTDPNDADSDDDTYNDKAEIDAGKDPNNPYSYPGFEYYGFETSTVPSAWNVYSDTGVLQVGELASGVSGEARKYLRWTVSGYWDRLKVSSISSIAAEVDFWINIHNYGNSGTYPERGLSFGVWNSAYSYAVNTISWGYNGLYRMVAGVGAKIADYTINTWYHVRLTWNCSAGFSEIYINGDFITSWAISTYASYSQVTFLNSMNVQPRYVDIDEFYSDNKNVDLDNDGMPSYYEVEKGLDPADESDNVTDLDSDLLLNIYEFGNLTDPNDPDTDDDLLEDGEELLTYLTNPNDADSDDDTLTDYAELIMYGTDPNDSDSDNDLLLDAAEINTYSTDPNDPDSDNDLLNDGVEINTHGTDPNDPDSDDDTLNDYAEVITYNTDPNDADSDNDLLTDAAEINTHDTDPNDADSDNDLLNDFVEINTHGTDPNDADSDNDLLNDGVEINTHGTDPNDPDSDDDGFSDRQEIDAGTDPNNDISYPGYIAPERLLGFFILLSTAALVALSGIFIAKKQSKRRFVQ